MAAVVHTREKPERALPSDKAARIVEAMRASVALRGAANSTFDHVAREAGVSRGLLHYYFGTKERLLVEVVRREAEVRDERLRETLSGAETADDVIDALVAGFADYMGDDRSLVILCYELMTLGQRNEEIGAELAQLGRRMRDHLAEVLAAKHASGALKLAAGADVVAGLIFAIADGLTVRALSEPELDIAPILLLAVKATRSLLS